MWKLNFSSLKEKLAREFQSIAHRSGCSCCERGKSAGDENKNGLNRQREMKRKLEAHWGLKWNSFNRRRGDGMPTNNNYCVEQPQSCRVAHMGKGNNKMWSGKCSEIEQINKQRSQHEIFCGFSKNYDNSQTRSKAAFSPDWGQFVRRKCAREVTNYFRNYATWFHGRFFAVNVIIIITRLWLVGCIQPHINDETYCLV